MDGNKLTGTYRCVVCRQIWDGGEVRLDSQSSATRFICHDYMCSSPVRKVSELPKAEYLRNLETGVNA